MREVEGGREKGEMLAGEDAFVLFIG